jgi:hypothetical protein
MKAHQFASAKNVTVADLNIRPKAFYLLSEDDYWTNDYAREAATDAVLKKAATEWVGYDRAIEIIEQTRAKGRAREEAMARAMTDDVEAAKRQAEESGERWNEPAWKAEWIRENWDNQREADFEAE